MLAKRIAKRSPLLAQLNNEFDHFGSLLDMFSNSMGASTLPGIKSADFIPPLEAIEKEDSFEISAELPGMDTEDIDISINDDNMLVIKGEKKCCREETDDKSEVHFREVSYGSFRREVSLPQNINKDDVAAKNKNGILKITIPKKEIEKPKFKKILIEQD